MTYLHMYGVLTYLDGSKYPFSKIILYSTLESHKTMYTKKVLDNNGEFIECSIYFKSFYYESYDSNLVDFLSVKRKAKEIRIINA